MAIGDIIRPFFVKTKGFFLLFQAYKEYSSS